MWRDYYLGFLGIHNYHTFRALLRPFSLFYFPININQRHWIAGVIDFEQKTYGYGSFSYRLMIIWVSNARWTGDSLAPNSQLPRWIVQAVWKWLSDQFGGKFVDSGDYLEHGDQVDHNSCGIILINTIAGATLQHPIWTQEKAIMARLEWFGRFTKYFVQSHTGVLNSSPRMWSLQQINIRTKKLGGKEYDAQFGFH